MTDYKCRRCRDTGKFYVVTAGGDEVLCDCECPRKGLEHLPLEAQDRIIALRQHADACPPLGVRQDRPRIGAGGGWSERGREGHDA